jgi:endo-beta-N-acetylglucosaminidase D
LNIEAPLRRGANDAPKLLDFIKRTREACRRLLRPAGASLVLVYDAIDERTGAVRYRNALDADHNLAQFAAADGMFLNYWWTAAELARSADLAGPRRFDVYAGVDCFARHTSYGPGPLIAPALAEIARAGLSCALFAPAWTLEAGPARDAQTPQAAQAADALFWRNLDLDRILKRRQQQGSPPPPPPPPPRLVDDDQQQQQHHPSDSEPRGGPP